MSPLRHGLFLPVLAVCILALPLIGFAQDAPVLHAPQPRFEFEPVSEGTRITHDFSLLNKGDSTLVIGRIHTD
jgi:hypothetical protein